MTDTARHDVWAQGTGYERYIGRWSRPVAAAFLDWLALPRGLAWLDVGCGTGELAFLARAVGQLRGGVVAHDGREPGLGLPRDGRLGHDQDAAPHRGPRPGRPVGATSPPVAGRLVVMDRQ